MTVGQMGHSEAKGSLKFQLLPSSFFFLFFFFLCTCGTSAFLICGPKVLLGKEFTKKKKKMKGVEVLCQDCLMTISWEI